MTTLVFCLLGAAVVAAALLTAVGLLVFVLLRTQRQNERLLDRVLAIEKPAAHARVAAAATSEPVQTRGHEPAPAAVEPGTAVGQFPIVS
jgi:hypothetical protein